MTIQHFDNYLLDALQEFHTWQLEHLENGIAPYSYDTLGLAEWLEFERLLGGECMSKIHGTYLVEFYDGTQIVCGNNYKTWSTHAYEYARRKFREDKTPIEDLLASVKFSDTPFVDDGGLKYATPKAYDKMIAEMNQEYGKKLIPFGEIDFYFSNADKKKLDKELAYELS